MAKFCGKDCSVSIDDGSAFDGYQYTIDLTAEENDVRAFGDGLYGSWLSCARSGIITIQSYDNPATSVGEVADVVCIIGDPMVHTFTMNACVNTSVNVSVDAKGIVSFSSTWRITGDPSIS